MPQRIFAVGRARRARRVAEPLPPVSNLAAAGRRQRPPRNPQSAEASSTPPATAIVPGGLSKRRLAGTGELAQRERETTARPAAHPGAAALPIKSLSGQEQAALWDWYDFDKKRSLITGTAALPVSAAAQHRPASVANGSPGRSARSGQFNQESQSARAVRSAPGLNEQQAQSGRPATGQQVGSPAAADRPSSGRSASTTGSWGSAPGQSAQPSGQQAAVQQESRPDPTAELRATVGPPAHPLRRVIDPAAGQRTHPRRVGHEPPTEPRPDKTSKQPRQAKTSRTGSTRPPEEGRSKSTKPIESAGAADRRVAARKRRIRLAGWSLLGLAVVALAASAWVGWRASQAYTRLEAASVAVQELQDQLSDITAADPEATATTIAGLQAETAAALEAVDDPIYRLATGVPFVGPNLDAIRVVTVNVDSLATKVMPSLVDIARNLQPTELAPKNGQIDLAPIEAISPLLQDADVAVNDARTELAGIDQSALLGSVASAVQTVSTKLDNAADVTGPGARTARLLPPMLGSEGPRTYLVVFQNPAETRATGGIFGSYATLTADQGKITIDDQANASRTLDDLKAPLADLTANEEALYSSLIAQRPEDVNFTPDFPTAAQRFIQMYQLKNAREVDGVLAIDPVALSYMLEGSPGIPVGNDKVITSDNLVQTLLSDAYTDFPGKSQAERDAFLDEATGKVFSEVMSGTGDPHAILNGLRKASAQRRVMVYSTNPAEQADIAQTGLAASLDADAGHPTLGIFLNDGTAGKLDYYLHNQVQVTEGACRTDGRRELKVQVTMDFQDPGGELPTYVTHSKAVGDHYTMKTNLLAFAPIGGGVTGVVQDGKPVGLGRGQDHGHEVGTVTVELEPGESTVVTFTVLGPPDVGTATDVPPSLILTPGVNEWVSSVAEYQACAPTVG